MSDAPFEGTRLKILQRVLPLFLTQGYHALTMTGIATACGLTRRGLYHHFSGKEEIFRATIVQANFDARSHADWTAQKALAQDGSALDIVTGWLDSRFGQTRRALGRTPFGDELNQLAFKLCSDIMIEVSHQTNDRLAALLNELCRRGMLTLKPGRTATELAALIGDGARGVNQQRPPAANNEIARRYRQVTAAILYGTCVEP